MKKLMYSLLILVAVMFISCDDDSSVYIDGNTDLEYTKVGTKFNLYGASANMDNDSTVVIANDNGNVTIDVSIFYTQKELSDLNDSVGFTDMFKSIFDSCKTQNDSMELAHTLISPFLERYGFELDYGNPEKIVFHGLAKGRVTSNGIQEFHTGGDNSPHTIVEYDKPVGTTWSFVDKEGRSVQRKITAKSTENDYPYGFMNIKAIKTCETYKDYNDPLVDSLVYVTNHKFGLVAITAYLKNKTSQTICIMY